MLLKFEAEAKSLRPRLRPRPMCPEAEIRDCETEAEILASRL